VKINEGAAVTWRTKW